MENFDGWIRINDWYKLYPHEKPSAVHKRIADGRWPRGEYYSSPEGDSGFLHLERCKAWLEERGKHVPLPFDDDE